MAGRRRRIQVMGLRVGLALALAALVACATAEPPSEIENRDWYLFAIGEQTLSVPTEGARPTLRLENHRAAGYAGCNHFAGNYTLAGPDLKFGPTASTKMFCQETATIEDRYLADLGHVVHWSIEGDQLTLSSDQGPVLRFKELTSTRRVR
jgi:heat shock protein HslJ